MNPEHISTILPRVWGRGSDPMSDREAAFQNLIQCAERWHELWAQDQRYTIWENTPEGQATHWAVSEEECAEFASDAFDCDKMRDDLAEAERNLINAYETAKYGKSTSDTVSEVLWKVLS